MAGFAASYCPGTRMSLYLCIARRPPASLYQRQPAALAPITPGPFSSSLLDRWRSVQGYRIRSGSLQLHVTWLQWILTFLGLLSDVRQASLGCGLSAASVETPTLRACTLSEHPGPSPHANRLRALRI
ncbi:hypothetical protein BU26DRAFT_521148 [Trematosphaeria pertusa]|uniref:Uncharacterized protein n=1 Tax=Trematosphaeria pertusa TaxID=390896 RepID=A0A6A6IAZ7_9PLEO|nr:uncharacterized protein BU26DRAFT_521148 [Trematosphaeria pertusa]KAF2246710.1 hypothetical protein BU26DRAFT_521148 [Trematosphaeria pertusa]